MIMKNQKNKKTRVEYLKAWMGIFRVGNFRRGRGGGKGGGIHQGVV